MDNYNPDLIFDLASGLLPEDEATAAEAALSPEGRAELAAQRAVMAAIAQEGPTSMTDIERARMHRSVADGIAATTRELSPVAIAQPRTSPRSSRSIRLFKWASAATAAALFVGVVAVGSQLTGLGDRDGSDTTTPLLSSEAVGTSDTTGAAAASTTTMATNADSAALSEGGLSALQAPPVRDDANPSDLEEVGDFVLEALQTRRLLPTSSEFNDPSELECYEEASDDNVVLLGFIAPYEAADGEMIEAIGYAFETEDSDQAAFSYYRPDTCEPILSNTEPPTG